MDLELSGKVAVVTGAGKDTVQRTVAEATGVDADAAGASISAPPAARRDPRGSILLCDEHARAARL
jgi:hypothetical protein